MLDSTYIATRQRCESVLEGLLARVDDVSLALLAFCDGLPLLLRSRERLDSGKLAAMSASMAALSDTLLREVSGDAAELTLLEGKNGKILVLRVPVASQLLLLMVHARSTANLGRLLVHAKECAAKVAAVW